MVWIDIIEEEGMRFYSVTDSIQILHESFFAFWMGVSPGVLILIVLFIGTALIGGLLYSIQKSIKRGVI